MIPENQPKPNLERIADVIGKAMFPTERHYPNLLKDWENIEMGKISYPDIPEMESLLIKNDIPLSLLPDFKFMGFQFKLQKDWISKRDEAEREKKSFYLETLKALKLLNDYPKGISIQFKRKQKIQASIENPEIIQVIKEALSLKMGESLNPKDIPIKLKLYQEFFHKSGRGDKKHHSFGFSIYVLKLYLQEFTTLKEQSERKQNAFIHRFLQLWGLIEASDTWKEDNIRIALNKYLKSEKNQDYLFIKQKNQSPDIQQE